MKSTSFQVSTIQDLEQEILRVKGNNFHPTLGILFGSVDCELNALPAIFNKYNIDLVGCSSSGEICQENIYEKGITGLFMDINRDFYKIHVGENVEDRWYEVGNDLGKVGTDFCADPSFLTFFGMVSNAEDIIRGINDKIGKQVNIFGGMAGDDFKMIQSYTFSSTGVFNNAVVSLIFNQEKIEMKGRAIGGWEPIGSINTITKAEGNIVYSINNRTAVEAFESYFGSFHDNLEEVETVAVGVAQYPLQIVRKDSTVLRAALKIDEENQSIILAGPVKTGDQFKFSVAPGFEIIEDTIQEFKEYQAENLTTDAMILVSCKARHMSLGPMVEEEIKGIQNLWNKPLIGFFAYGEVGVNSEGDCNFYNQTCSLVLIREK
ncbi:MAG: FIST signal transduction protein [Saprospiraceae bacterium]